MSSDLPRNLRPQFRPEKPAGMTILMILELWNRTTVTFKTGCEWQKKKDHKINGLTIPIPFHTFLRCQKGDLWLQAPRYSGGHDFYGRHRWEMARPGHHCICVDKASEGRISTHTESTPLLHNNTASELQVRERAGCILCHHKHGHHKYGCLPFRGIVNGEIGWQSDRKRGFIFSK